MTEQYAVAIVGSGPGGMSAAGRAAANGVSHVLFEKSDHLSDTIYKYQKGKLVMATPDNLPLRSEYEFSLGIREDILGSWDKTTETLGVNVRYNSEVTGITGQKGDFTITLNSGDTVKAEHVIFAIGLQGNLRKLGVPGEDESGLVQYQLDDPDEYEAEDILVVGAGDAAIENAVALAKQNRVTIINRRDEFARAKEGNLALISTAIQRGDLNCIYSASPVKVENGALTLSTPDGEIDVKCDRVIARLGAVAPRKFVESCGIVFPSKDATALPEVSSTYESNVPGLYIIGALGGYPLIKQAMNQGYEAIEFIAGNMIKPADEPLLEENFKILQGMSVAEVLDMIRANVPIYSELNPLLLREMMLEASLHRPKDGEVVFARNDYTNSFFTVVEGEVLIEVDPSDPSVVVRLGQGEFFGEMGLISGRRRTATVKAGRNATLLEVPRRTMIKLVNSVESVKRVLDRTAIIRQVQTHMAPSVPTEDLIELVDTAEINSFKQGQALFEEGQAGDSVHLIRRGSVTVSRRIGGSDIVLSYVASGNYVGEMAFLSDAPRSATVRAAIDNTETIRMDGAAFKALLDKSPTLSAAMQARARGFAVQNERMAQSRDASGIIEFLVKQGAGEATDILLIDESLCVRCDNCEKACAETHGGINRLNREAGPTYAELHVPTSCRHCEHPHCMKDCPPDAIHRAQNGEVYIDDSCIGCGNCEMNCPYDVIRLSAAPPKKPGLLSWMLFGLGSGPGQDPKAKGKGAKQAVKCDMCKDIPGGASCVRACPTGAAIRVSPEEFMSIAALARQ
ncbi:cyclic nucleotide-binding domain-containing protein [Oceanibacterium hippocampi]|uniref:Hydrogenase-4 component A n=1 Tax=Oceanibacterium hippocampi TaxID=745714 RepID=A0A1Y5T7P6_9PROT|nr:cyclic nucleotide-binding domain-containing protein [Oceanibacterium hippocampi]SLN57300.1 Hydrogenase-4 component A [Oceanibacterium hippocampi]